MTLHIAIPIPERLVRFVEADMRPVQRLAVVRPEHVEAQRFARPGITLPTGQQLVDGHEVAEALRHLLAFHLQEAVVHPDLRHDVGAVGAARLSDLILVVREDEVDPAPVNVEHLAEMRRGHGRALDVPAGASGRLDAARRRPGRFARLRRLPKHEVHRIFLEGRDFDPRPRQHLVERPARELAVVGHRRNTEQHMALGHVGAALGDQAVDHGAHLGDVLRGTRLDGRV